MEYNNFNQLRENFNAIVPLRCLLLKTYDIKKFEIMMTMETHNEIRKNIRDIWLTNQLMIVDKIRNIWGLREYSEDEIHSICGILEVNVLFIFCI